MRSQVFMAGSPLGPMWGRMDEEGRVARLTWGAPPAEATGGDHPLAAWLQAYWAGERLPLPAAVLAPQGTPFQQRVWQALRAIPYGQTRTYGALAAELGSAPRAVGGAVGKNPLGLVVPCHRVMGHQGALTGFSAPNGLADKEILLRHEGALLT